MADAQEGAGKLRLVWVPPTENPPAIATLAGADYDVVEFSDPMAALSDIWAQPPEVVILGETLPQGFSGFNLCRLIKGDSRLSHLPVMVVTDGQPRPPIETFRCGVDAVVPVAELPLRLSNDLSVLRNVYTVARQQLVAQRPAHPAAIHWLAHRLDRELVIESIQRECRLLVELIPDLNLLTHLWFSLLEQVVTYESAALLFSDPRPVSQTLYLHRPDHSRHSDQTLSTLQAHLVDGFGLSADSVKLELIGTHGTPAATPPAAGPAQSVEAPTVLTFFMDDNPVSGVFLGGLALFGIPADEATGWAMTTLREELFRLMTLRALSVKTEILAVSDPLTQLPSTNQFLHLLERDVIRAKRYEYPLSLILLDIQGFRELNETQGTAVGDEVLKYVAKILRKSVRGADILSRFGPDSFAVVLVNSDAEVAAHVRGRILNRLVTDPLVREGDHGPETIQVSVQSGAATLAGPGLTTQALIQQAERAMVPAGVG